MRGTLDTSPKLKNPAATDCQCSTTMLFALKMWLSPLIYMLRKALWASQHVLSTAGYFTETKTQVSWLHILKKESEWAPVTNILSLVSTNPTKNDAWTCAIYQPPYQDSSSWSTFTIAMLFSIVDLRVKVRSPLRVSLCTAFWDYYWDSAICKLAAFTGFSISIGGYWAAVVNRISTTAGKQDFRN